MTARSHRPLAVLVAAGMLLSGCITVTGSYGSSSGFSPLSTGTSPSVFEIRSKHRLASQSVLTSNPYRPSSGGQARRQGPPIRVGTRDFRDGDQGYHREQRRRDGTSLLDRSRLDRQEIIREDRQDRTQAAIESRSRGVVIEGTEPGGYGQRLDNGQQRRLDRASQEERANQLRALEVRRKMLARQREARRAGSPTE